MIPMDARGPLRILVADDDARTRLLCREFLEGMGHRVTVAEEGLEAIGLLRDGAWDLVLADEDMPGASGVDVLERAIALQPGAMRVLMSDVADERTVAEALTRGQARAVIQKPTGLRAFQPTGRLVPVQ